MKREGVPCKGFPSSVIKTRRPVPINRNGAGAVSAFMRFNCLKLPRTSYVITNRTLHPSRYGSVNIRIGRKAFLLSYFVLSEFS